MGSGGVAIAALPTVICLKVPFSDGLGGCHFNNPLLGLSFKLEHTVCQVHCFNFLFHVHLCVNLRGRDAAMPQNFANRV